MNVLGSSLLTLYLLYSGTWNNMRTFIEPLWEELILRSD